MDRNGLYMLLARHKAGPAPETADIAFDVVATADQLTYQFYAQPRKEFTIEWGDGTTGTVPTGVSTQSHTYAAAGMYTIKVQDTTGLFDYTHYMKPGAGSSSTAATVVACAAMVAEVRSWNTRAFTVWTYCFDRCSNMTGLEIPAGTTLISNYAFRACEKWHPSPLPDTVTRVKEGCFRDCVLIDWTSLPSALATNIETNTFRGCTNLALTSLPDALASFGSYAFYGCVNIALTSLPSSLTSVGQSAFYGCSALALTSLPTGLTTIGAEAFRYCSHLALSALPSTVTSIGNGAFQDCWKTGGDHTITFLGTPTSISSSAFLYCLKITDIYVPWAQDAVTNAPWGATNAHIWYNHTT